MNWYTIARVRRIVRIDAPNGFWNRFFSLYLFGNFVCFYQYGLKQINDYGDTRIIWENKEGDI